MFAFLDKLLVVLFLIIVGILLFTFISDIIQNKNRDDTKSEI